ncbi:hypothetical protein LJC19_08220 [Oxalobacter sp. OttesenSCG-928-P03]|nr:hypothetical protein [Oxalobacter sp. OttesenSCG-928-P03]
MDNEKIYKKAAQLHAMLETMNLQLDDEFFDAPVGWLLLACIDFAEEIRDMADALSLTMKPMASAEAA